MTPTKALLGVALVALSVVAVSEDADAIIVKRIHCMPNGPGAMVDCFAINTLDNSGDTVNNLLDAACDAVYPEC